jgi:hypothetical protein
MAPVTTPAAASAPAGYGKKAPPAAADPVSVKMGDALQKFVASDRIRKDPEGFCKYEAFVKHFKDFCLKTSIVPADNAAVTPEAVYEATGLTAERDVYKAYPGKNGAIQKGSWILGVCIQADETHGALLSLLSDFLGQPGVFAFRTDAYMKYQDFVKCLDAYCLQKRAQGFKPNAKLLKDVCVRYNMALETNGVRDGVKGKYLLGVTWASA